MRQELEIGGMSCAHCVASVRGALERLPGVQVEEVRIGSATVAFDEARAKPEAIRQAVEDAGYDVVTTSGR